ncbi:MAG: SpoIIE family protein phosphatase [Candidatus Zhuqueibacterota bacterium]
MKKLISIVFLFCTIGTGIGQDDAPFRILSKQILSGETVRLTTSWKFCPIDSAAFASPGFDDRAWEFSETHLSGETAAAKNWNGIGWFRLHVKIDSSLINAPLGLKIVQAGACEIFIDGELVRRFGVIGTSSRDEQRFFSRFPTSIVFKDSTHHIIAIRYSNYYALQFNAFNSVAGFAASISDFDDSLDQSIAMLKKYTTNKFIFTLIPIIIAIYHLLIFLYYPRLKENLFYAIMLLGFAVLILAQFQPYLTTNFYSMYLYNRLFFLAMLFSTLLGLFTTYSNLPRFPNYTPVIILLNLGMMLLLYFQSSPTIIRMALFLMIIEFLEILRVMTKLKSRGRFNVWIIRIGFLILFASVAYQILIGFNVVQPVFGIVYPYLIGLIAMIFSMSLDMAYDFAATARNLEKQLIQVKELSQKTLEQERLAREREIDRLLLEVDNQRKTGELEDARQFQLSMLPRFTNDFPGLDICFEMRTATEVGGDYYDSLSAEDGSVIFAVGDATGHGMKAGMMILTIKSLFHSFAPGMGLAEFLKTCSGMIKKVKLSNSYMALSLLKIRGATCTVTSAGMPPLLIYRSSADEVEEVVLKSMFLGGPVAADFPSFETELQAGDVLLLMSDGFPELFNEQKEMLDYPRVKDIFKNVARLDADKIVTELFRAADVWRRNRNQEDDVTFAVIKKI